MSAHGDQTPMAAAAAAAAAATSAAAAPSRAGSNKSRSGGGGSPRQRQKYNPDKVGRWTDEEHLVFLDGLEKHGKEWKTIATMIGTRTVVQVRTHAQKYFQKQERRNKASAAASTGSENSFSGVPILTTKRKTLPPVMPSDHQRSKKMHKTESTASIDKPSVPIVKQPPRISISLTNIPSCDLSRDAPTPTADIIQHLSAVSCSSSSENLSTISPAGVNELDLGLWGGTDTNFYMDSQNYQDTVVDDPLEWFNLDAPDVPIFPDFQEPLDFSLAPKPDYAAGAAVEILPCMDPKVTVQSLFLEEQPLLM